MKYLRGNRIFMLLPDNLSYIILCYGLSDKIRDVQRGHRA